MSPDTQKPGLYACFWECHVSRSFLRMLPVIIFRTGLVLCLFWVCGPPFLVLLHFIIRPIVPVLLVGLIPPLFTGSLHVFLTTHFFDSYVPCQNHSQGQDWHVGSWSNSPFPVAFPPTCLPPPQLLTLRHPSSGLWSFEAITYMQPTRLRMRCYLAASSFCQKGSYQWSQSDSPQSKNWPQQLAASR